MLGDWPRSWYRTTIAEKVTSGAEFWGSFSEIEDRPAREQRVGLLSLIRAACEHLATLNEDSPLDSDRWIVMGVILTAVSVRQPMKSNLLVWKC
jgi:hypothetical protein